MKTTDMIVDYPISRSLLANDILEFHASRLLLIFYICSQEKQFSGLTKMAKIDFFVRYPRFFLLARNYLNNEGSEIIVENYIESKMIRYHYGPWDQRYYQVLAYLQAKNLIDLSMKGKTVVFQITNLGSSIAKKMFTQVAFSQVVNQIIIVNNEFGKMTGNQLKKLIYEVFENEINNLSLGEIIQ